MNPYESPRGIEASQRHRHWSKWLLLGVLAMLFFPAVLLYGVLALVVVNAAISFIAGETAGMIAGGIAAAAGMAWAGYRYVRATRNILA
jgi:hypothetical protein